MDAFTLAISSMTAWQWVIIAIVALAVIAFSIATWRTIKQRKDGQTDKPVYKQLLQNLSPKPA